VKVTFTSPFAGVTTGGEELNAVVAPLLGPAVPRGSGVGAGAVLV
jgi:hypothetical protein